jgi:hypothetical protein
VGAELTGSDQGVAGARRVDQAIEHRPGVRRLGGGREARPSAAVGIGGQGELGHQQQAAAGVGKAQVHAPIGIVEHAVAEYPLGHALRLRRGVARLHADQHQQARPDLADGSAGDADAGLGDPLQQRQHAQSAARLWRRRSDSSR